MVKYPHFLDLFDHMYDLADSLTFTMRSISPNMWPVYELSYDLFKKDAHDFLEGGYLNYYFAVQLDKIHSVFRDATSTR